MYLIFCFVHITVSSSSNLFQGFVLLNFIHIWEKVRKYRSGEEEGKGEPAKKRGRRGQREKSSKEGGLRE